MPQPGPSSEEELLGFLFKNPTKEGGRSCQKVIIMYNELCVPYARVVVGVPFTLYGIDPSFFFTINTYSSTSLSVDELILSTSLYHTCVA